MKYYYDVSEATSKKDIEWEVHSFQPHTVMQCNVQIYICLQANVAL
jgi:hypothetical protein